MDISGLVEAMSTLNARDALRLHFSATQWVMLGRYLVPVNLGMEQRLLRQGDPGRALYLLERGSLHVSMDDGRRIAILRPGAVVGEAGLFGNTPRMASVYALAPSRLWSLSGTRFDELSVRAPAVALEVARGCAAVLAERLRASQEQAIPVS